MTSRRTKPLPPGWAKTVRRILKRDNHRCYRCDALATEVDHIVPASQGGTDDDNNLAAICTPCHRRKTASEAVHARHIKYTRRRPQEPHPGGSSIGGG